MAKQTFGKTEKGTPITNELVVASGSMARLRRRLVARGCVLSRPDNPLSELPASLPRTTIHPPETDRTCGRDH